MNSFVRVAFTAVENDPRLFAAAVGAVVILASILIFSRRGVTAKKIATTETNQPVSALEPAKFKAAKDTSKKPENVVRNSRPSSAAARATICFSSLRGLR